MQRCCTDSQQHVYRHRIRLRELLLVQELPRMCQGAFERTPSSSTPLPGQPTKGALPVIYELQELTLDPGGGCMKERLVEFKKFLWLKNP